MDSSKDSSPMTNSAQLDDDGETHKNNKNIPSQLGQRVNAENVFTSAANQSSSFVPLNGPVENHTDSLPSTDTGSQISRHSGSNNETNKKASNSSSVEMCNNKVPKFDVEQSDFAVAGSSRSVPVLYDNGIEPDKEKQTCQRHKVCLDKAATVSLPSTSGTSRPCENSACDLVSSCRENRKRPSSLKLNRPSLVDDSSSDTGNDDYSLGSEDGCIYTYRGGEHLADLPSSFFSLDMGLPLDKHLPMPNYPGPQQAAAPVREQASRASSPDMDFLEMDFDPGPSCEVDTGDESSPDADVESASNMPEENEPVLREISPEYVPVRYNPVPVPVPASTASGSHGDADIYSCSLPSTSQAVVMGHGAASERSHHNYTDQNFSFGPYITHINTRGEQLVVRRTMAHGPANSPAGLHISSGDLVSAQEILNYEQENTTGPYAFQINTTQPSLLDSANLSSALYHVAMAKKLIADKVKSQADNEATAKASEETPSTSSTGAVCVEPPQCMIWSESEACERQVTQIGTSACGATAVVNVFNALGVPVNLEKINSAIGTRQRANNAPLPRYLLSRAVAGCTAADLVSGIQRASDGLVTARFFPTHPERVMSLSHWLADWITLGAVPILTLNLQAGCESNIPDAWHHQMVFGVGPRGVFVCNPLACVREPALWPRLAAPAALLVRARDVLARFTPHTDLTPLMAVPDPRFHTFNVLGQIVNLIREYRAIGWGDYGTRTRHIRIPASYQAGITISALTGSEAHRRLMLAPQLPILKTNDPA